jgi:hypothetical protein
MKMLVVVGTFLLKIMSMGMQIMMEVVEGKKILKNLIQVKIF